MQGVNKRIKDLQDMITNAEELLEDEMARIMLGDDGIEAIEYMIKHYQNKIQELKNKNLEKLSVKVVENMSYDELHDKLVGLLNNDYKKYENEIYLIEEE